MTSQVIHIIGWSVFTLFCLIAFFSTLYTVQQQKIAVIERFGKFNRLAQPGLNIKLPFIERVANFVSLKDYQLDVEVETKTLDDVFVKIVVAIQHRVLPDKVYESFYKLTSFNKQISSYVFDVVRAEVPKLKLDDVFAKKDDIANAIKDELAENMTGYGIEIIKALITDIDPDGKVKEAMNQINEIQSSDSINYNQLVRWINTKEKHAELIQEIADQYFLTQRVKFAEPSDKEKYAGYINQLTYLHQLIVYSMKAKQSTDLVQINNLSNAIEKFEIAYFGKDAHRHDHNGEHK